jgi:hypothetical protein
LPGRIDSLLATRSPDVVVALAVAQKGSSPFLPHDALFVITAGRHQRRVRISLPPYSIPPGMVSSPDGGIISVVDRSLLVISPFRARVLQRWRLDVQAIGWPAAVAVDARGRIYLAGQPQNASSAAALAEALQVRAGRFLRVLWRRALGVTHAGTWLGIDARGHLAAYVPDAHDASGIVALLDARSGTLRRVYAVPAPPIALDTEQSRLYVADAGTIHALDLESGTTRASMAGLGPLAVDPARGLVAFRQGSALVLASARTLHLIARMRLQDLTAVAATPDGSAFWLGLDSRLARVQLKACRAR